MYLIAIAWIYVVLMMALVEAMSAQGTVLGALITFVLYGVLPLSLLMYILGTPGRRRLRQRAESSAASADESGAPPTAQPTAPSTALSTALSVAPSDSPDGGGHAARDTVAPEREKP